MSTKTKENEKLVPPSVDTQSSSNSEIVLSKRSRLSRLKRLLSEVLNSIDRNIDLTGHARRFAETSLRRMENAIRNAEIEALYTAMTEQRTIRHSQAFSTAPTQQENHPLKTL